MIEITEQEAHLLFTSAARYAVGRSTYVASEIAKIVGAHAGELYPATCSVIARDVRRFDEDRGRARSELYHRLDVQPYIDLLPALDARAKGES